MTSVFYDNRGSVIQMCYTFRKLFLDKFITFFALAKGYSK